ncbi:MAG TPA: CDGSH iron-sulfur domain-containing protein [Mariprofundaceae bacterium]|nr:CDGSH iron-sulfur domain-containing protein [Mariprofundaceae bacterium]
MKKGRIAAKEPKVMDLEPGTYYWCACGRSANQPFCDGSHKDTGFTPREINITEKRKVALCQCKQSNNAPFCDGSHADL